MATEPINVYVRYGNEGKDVFYHDFVLRIPKEMWNQLSKIAVRKYHTSINALIRGYIRDGLQAEIDN